MKAENFWENVKVGAPDECWEWQRARRIDGHGVLRFQGKPEGAHRVAYMLAKGPIPDGIVVCHQCDNGACCNPAHLWLGTQSENMIDAFKKGRHSSAIVTDEDVRKIRWLYHEKRITQRDIAKQFGINQSNVSHIINRKRWSHITDEGEI